MKFPRNARIFKGQLDAAPVATVFFLLVLFILLGSLVYTPGVKLELPGAENLPGTDKPTIPVAVDANGRMYFESHLVSEAELRAGLSLKVKHSPEALALLLQADEHVPYQMLMRVAVIGREAGINEAWLVALPRAAAR